MAANTSQNLVSLDFDTVKADLRAYLESQEQFRDYDFDGSNMNVLLELLSYNTNKNSFYLNMVLSEAFMDSAQLRSSITSHAKELNYLPTSYKSAKANITVSFEASGESAPYTIAKGSLFSSIIKNEAFAFTIPETITVSSSSNTTYSFTTDIYEGYYVRDSYIYLTGSETQTFKITNKNVDTDSITVAVYEDGSDTPIIFTKTQTLLGINNNSKIYFIQGTGNGFYEILFGDGIFGRKPKAGSTIVIDYRNSSGIQPNGAALFSLDFDPTGASEMTDYTVTTVENAAGGAVSQTVESIRKLAPRYFASQQRAVSSDDYASLVLSEFSGIISDAAVYGGETLTPKLYGRVVVAIKPSSSDIAPDYIKEQVSNYLLKYVSIPTRVIIADADYLYTSIESTVQYDKALTEKKPAALKSLILNAIDDYNDLNLGIFGGDFRYSKFIKTIDDADGSIVSNDTVTKIIKRITPLINNKEYYTIYFNNELHPGHGHLDDELVLISDNFTYRDDADIDYPVSFLRDDGIGGLIIQTTINGEIVTINTNIGTIDYANGIAYIEGLKVSDYSDYISIKAQQLSKDIIISKDKILLIDASDVIISVVEASD